MSSLLSPNLNHLKALLHTWLKKKLSSEQLHWLEEKLVQVADVTSERSIFTTFSSIPRYLGKQDLGLAIADLEAAEALRPGWYPAHWSVDQTARSLVLLTVPSEDTQAYKTLFDKVFGVADVHELVALYQSLPILPHPTLHLNRAAEGIRSNMAVVFNAVALRNPYPADYFDVPAWNQMILKAIFIGSPLHFIWQLERRANPELARMVSDYAHERWAAKRPVTPELWRLIGPFLDEALIADLERVFATADPIQQTAAALACSQSALPQAQALLAQHLDLQADIESGRLTWDEFSQKIPH